MTMSFAQVLQITAKDLLSARPAVDYRDMTTRQRKVAGVLLNLVANKEYAPYPPTDEDRLRAQKRLGDLAWEFRAVAQQLGPSADNTFTVALEQALVIITEV
jgi:hypothetical protein